MSLKHHQGSITYKLLFNEDLANLLSNVAKWLKKHPDIHVWDVVIGGANNSNEEWHATIYYFTSDENLAEEANRK